MKGRTWVLAAVAGVAFWQWRRARERQNATSVKNKVVVITGAAAGIGQATAVIFAAQGAHVVLVDHDAAGLQETEQRLAEFPVRTLAITADISADESAGQIVDEVINRFGRLDVLVNNAAVLIGGYLDEQSPDDLRRMLDVNLYAPERLLQAVLPVMKQQNSGHIVNVSSISSVFCPPGQAAYAASKSGLSALSASVRHELAATPIRVSTVMVSLTKTPMTSGFDRQALSNAGIPAWFMSDESPEFVASNIVAAVRYNKRRVVLGGMAVQVMDWLSRMFPWGMEWALRSGMIAPDAFVQFVRAS